MNLIQGKTYKLTKKIEDLDKGTYLEYKGLFPSAFPSKGLEHVFIVNSHSYILDNDDIKYLQEITQEIANLTEKEKIEEWNRLRLHAYDSPITLISADDRFYHGPVNIFNPLMNIISDSKIDNPLNFDLWINSKVLNHLVINEYVELLDNQRRLLFIEYPSLNIDDDSIITYLRKGSLAIQINNVYVLNNIAHEIIIDTYNEIEHKTKLIKIENLT